MQSHALSGANEGDMNLVFGSFVPHEYAYGQVSAVQSARPRDVSGN
jgi:hypothetical protein